MKPFVFAQSTNNLPILGYESSNKTSSTLILGGVHGDEKEGVVVAMGLLAKLLNTSLSIVVIPIFNIDGFLANQRTNGRGVDLNRNLPTKDWDPKAFNDRYPPGPEPASEPENQALIQFITERKPSFVLSLHSFKKTLLNVNGDCLEEAQRLHKEIGYPIEESMGYPTPGCLGTYTGLERNIPTITYELLRGMDSKEMIEKHVPAILKMLESMR